MRATARLISTATTTVRPKFLKNCPVMPGIRPTGRNTATIQKLVATTGSPISSAASIDAWYALLPIRMCLTMFSISTIASSTRTPATSASASSDIWFRLKPSRSMNQKAGIADSGIAIAEMKVARQSRRKKNTTTTARIAPSIIAAIELEYCSLVYLTVSNSWMNRTSGLASSIRAISACASAKTVTSEAPLARLM